MIDLLRILAAYPRHLADARWVALGNAGGFSGSRIWHGTALDGQEFALKQYPRATTERQLERVHRWLKAAREQGLTYVPAVVSGRDGRTIAIVENRCWDVTTWMPGKADFHDDPTDVKLFAAVAALARIHRAWENLDVAFVQPCPALLRRWQAIRDAEAMLRNGPPPIAPSTDPLDRDIERAWTLLPRLIPRMLGLLAPWKNRPIPVQPCIGDVWHDHVLFEGECVTGIIDFAAAKLDAPAADLARLLGSLIPDEHERTRRALNVYTAIRPLPDRALVEVLDVAGIFGAMVNWLKRYGTMTSPDRARVAKRFAALVARMEDEAR